MDKGRKVKDFACLYSGAELFLIQNTGGEEWELYLGLLQVGSASFPSGNVVPRLFVSKFRLRWRGQHSQSLTR